MIQKCPKCGTWVEGEKEKKKDLADRAKGFVDSVKDGTIVRKIPSILTTGIFETAIADVLPSVIDGDAYSFQCHKCGNKWSSGERCDKTDEYNKEVVESYIETLQKISSNPRNESANLGYLIGAVKQKINEENPINRKIQLLNVLAVASCYDNDYFTAEDSINKSLKLSDNKYSRIIRGIIKYRSNEHHDSLQLYSILSDLVGINSEDRNETLYYTGVQLGQFEDSSKNYYFPERYVHDVYNEVVDAYANGFLSINPLQRRFVVLKDNIDRVCENIKVLPIAALPKGLLLTGHPRTDELYVQHPLKPNMYIPEESYDYEIFRDELYEFRWIMENLGAKHIEFTDNNEESEKNSSSREQDYGLGGRYEEFSAEGSYGNGRSSNSYDKLRQELQGSCDFSIGGKPALPSEEGLVWYQRNEEWQRQAKSRLEGRLIRHSFKFSTTSIERLSKSESDSIEVEMNYLVYSVKASYESRRQSYFKKSHTHNWSVDVEFYPLSEYKDE